jgi:hypothetical protein
MVNRFRTWLYRRKESRPPRRTPPPFPWKGRGLQTDCKPTFPNASLRDGITTSGGRCEMALRRRRGIRRYGLVRMGADS